MTETRTTNPMRGPNKFKLGVFSANCDGGLTMSLAPERWAANWDDIAAMCRIADRAGMEFILPVAKWRGHRRAYATDLRVLNHPRPAGDARVRGQGHRHHRSHYARARRAQHRLRLEPGGIRFTRRPDRARHPLRSRTGVVPSVVAHA